MRAASGVLVVMVACALACASSDTRERPATEPASAVLTVGSHVPVYSAVTLANDSISFGEAGDSLTLVNVWATWCTSCREEMQDLEALQREYAPLGVRVVAVSVDAGSEELVRRFVKREQLTFPVVHDQAGRLQQQYGVAGVPTTYVISADGRLAWQRVGGIHGAVGEVRTALLAVVGTPAAKR